MASTFKPNGSFWSTISNMKANEKEWLSWALIYINDVQSFVKPRSIAKLKSYINTACICFWIFQNGHNDWIGADTHSALSKVGVDRKKTFQHISFHLPAITFFYGNLSVIITFWRFSFSFSLYLSLLFYLVIVFVFVALPCNCISIFDVYLVIVFVFFMFTIICIWCLPCICEKSPSSGRELCFLCQIYRIPIKRKHLSFLFS